MLLVIRIVLAEYHITKALILINKRQHIELVLPDKVIRLWQCRICICIDELGERRHEFLCLRIHRHARNTIVTARHDAKQFARRRAILGNCHGRMACLISQVKDFCQGRCRLDIRITAHKA